MIEEMIASNRLIDPRTRDPERLLNGLGLLVNGEISNAAAALFGRASRLQTHYPQSQVRLARFKGVTKAEFLDSRQLTGNIFDLIDAAESFVAQYNPVQSIISATQMRRIDTPTYEPRAVREGMVNALAHRDYAESAGSVDIAIYDDRLEIVSTGGLRFGLTVDDLVANHQSRAWNPLISNVLQRAGYVENWGRGTLQMLEWTADAGLPAPVFEDLRLAMLVRFSSADKELSPSTRDADNTTQAILNLLEQKGPLAFSEIASGVNWNGTTRQLRHVLQTMNTANQIDHVGKNRGAKWQIRRS